MIAQLPTVLALLGTALTSVALFAPPRVVPAGPVVSFAPPLPLVPARDASMERAATAVERRPASDPFGLPNSFESPDRFESFDPVVPPVPGDGEPGWPVLVDPRAAGCDAAARLALVDALLGVRAPWADAILRRAVTEDRDPRVGARLAAGGYFEAGTA